MRTQREPDAQGAPRIAATDIKTLDFTAAPPCHADVGAAGRERTLRDMKAWLEMHGADLEAVDFAPCQASRGMSGHRALSRRCVVPLSGSAHQAVLMSVCTSPKHRRPDGAQCAVHSHRTVGVHQPGPSTCCLCQADRVWGNPQPRCIAAPAARPHPRALHPPPRRARARAWSPPPRRARACGAAGPPGRAAGPAAARRTQRWPPSRCTRRSGRACRSRCRAPAKCTRSCIARARATSASSSRCWWCARRSSRRLSCAALGRMRRSRHHHASAGVPVDSAVAFAVLTSGACDERVLI